MNYLEDIYKLKFVKRYSNVPRIHDESVAEHGFFVAAIVFDLYETYDFDLGKAVVIAVSHDMTEIELNDCPHIIKRKYPKIAEAYEECEKDVADLLPWPARWGAQQFDSKELSLESRIVHLADAIQCLQYSQIELKLGNRGYMEEVHEASEFRILKLKRGLEEHERGRKLKTKQQDPE